MSGNWLWQVAAPAPAACKYFEVIGFHIENNLKVLFAIIINDNDERERGEEEERVGERGRGET